MRYDLCTPRPKKDGGTHWHKIGAMFPSDKGGFSIILDSLPLPDKEGRVVVKAFEPREQGDRRAPPQQAPAAGGGFDDDIPFAPEVR
jgi:hypothetical protein